MNPDFHLTATNRQYLHQKIDQLDCSNGTWMVSIRPYKAKRSNPQNSIEEPARLDGGWKP